MKIFLAFITASLIWGTAFAQETTRERLAALDRNEAAAKQLAATTTKTTTKSVERSAIVTRCEQPLYVALNGNEGVRAICDVDNSGSADASYSFFRLPEESGNYVSALGTNRMGSVMFLATDQGSILRLSDTNQDGVADEKSTAENPGLAYTERILPLDGTAPLIYTENAQGGRFNLYRLERNETVVQGGDIPRGARRVAGSIMMRDGVLTIDAAQDMVRKYALNGVGYLDNTNSRNEVILRGERITSIAYDERASLLFVLMAGNCGDMNVPQPPPGGPTPLPSVVNTCSAPVTKVYRLTGTSLQQVGAMSHTLLNVSYNLSGHPMAARNGKLYVTVFGNDRERGRSGHQIIELRYDQATGRPIDVPTVFADSVHLGDYAYLKGLTFFDGGPAPVN